MNIHLVRHGESLANRDLNCLKQFIDPLVPLTPLGENQAWCAGDTLRTMLNPWTAMERSSCAIAFSPYKRAADTAAQIKGVLEPHVTVAGYFEQPLLVERNFGILGRYPTEYYEQHKEQHALYLAHAAQNMEFFAPAPVGGESPLEVSVRAKLAVMDIVALAEQLEVEHLIIVSHSGWIKSALIGHGIWTHDQYSTKIANCSIHSFQI